MDELEKSRHGRYEDNAKNRRLHRVGQEYGSKKQEEDTADPSKLSLDKLQREINELGHILSGRIKDGRRTEDVEQRISEMLKYAPDKVLESTLEALKTNVKPNPTAKIAAKLTEMEITRRKDVADLRESENFLQREVKELKEKVAGISNGTIQISSREKPKVFQRLEKVQTRLKEVQEKLKGLGEKVEEETKPVKPKEDTTKKEPKAQFEEPENFTRVKFDDMPQSGKVNLKKYLSKKIMESVDKAWKDKAKIGDKTLHDMEKGMVAEFNKNFDNLSKSKRAEALYSIITVKAEIARRSREARIEEKLGEQPVPKTEPAKEETKKEYKKPESFNELYTRTRQVWADIMETKPREINYTDPKEVAEMASAFFPGTEVHKVDGKDEFIVQYPKDSNRFIHIGKHVDSPKALINKIRMFLSMDVDFRIKMSFPDADKEKLNKLTELIEESIADRALVKNMDIERDKAFKEQVAENNKKISENVGIKQGKPMSFEEANQGRGNPKFRTNRLYEINCQTCVVVHELRLRGFDLGAKPKASSVQVLMANDSTFAWIDPLTGRQPEAIRITSAPDNGNTKVRKSQKSMAELRKNILEATKETGRYNFSYGWVDENNRKRTGGHIITAERHADGNLTFYDPQNGQVVPMVELLKDVSPKYLSRLIRVDNLLIKPDIVKDYAMHYE